MLECYEPPNHIQNCKINQKNLTPHVWLSAAGLIHHASITIALSTTNEVYSSQMDKRLKKLTKTKMINELE